ncbi:MAG: DNA polymerase III subunit beta [Thermostichales cyanobacterium SRBZ-1_bins_19]
MKLVCAQQELSQHLSLVSRAISGRPTLPILSHILLEADAKTSTLALTGFDLSLGIRTQLSADVTESGSLAVPARLFSDMVNRLPSGAPISLSQRDGDLGLGISCLTGQYQVRGLGAEDYPALPEIDAGQQVALTVEHWLAGIGQTLFAVSSDESKQILTGVHIKLEADVMEFAATDGHRLAAVQIPLAEPAPMDFALTLPARTLKELEKILNLAKVPSLSFAFDNSQVRLVLPQQVLTSRLLEGQYPNYALLIPNQFERQVTVERKPLLEALERIAIFAEQKNNIVRFSFDSDQQTLIMAVDAPDVGTGQESLMMQMTGPDLDIAFNVKYLLDALKVMSTQAVRINLNGNTQPAVWQPVGGSLFRYLVMPVQLRS